MEKDLIGLLEDVYNALGEAQIAPMSNGQKYNTLRLRCLDLLYELQEKEIKLVRVVDAV